MLFAGNLVLLETSEKDLQYELIFSAACIQAGMKFSTRKTEPNAHGNTLLHVEKFKHPGVVFASDGRLNKQFDKRIGENDAVLREL